MRASRPLSERLPEISIVLSGALLNFAWEALQCPTLFAHAGEMSHADGVRMCVRATLGDVNILLAGFWVTALASPRRRRWLLEPRRWEQALFLALGVGVTVVYELLATRVWGRWSYSDAMPVLFGVGLAPVAQWLAIPPMVLRLARLRVPARVA